MKINWKEVFKFLSGAAFVVAGANVPFAGFTLTPEFLGVRSLVGFVLFLIFFYFGFLKK